MHQSSLGFSLIENFRLIYEDIFAGIQEVLGTGKSHKQLPFVGSIDIDEQKYAAWTNILSRRDELMSRSADKSTNETEYRQKLISPIMYEVLGYDIMNNKAEEHIKEFGFIDDFYIWDSRYLPIESKKYGRIQNDNFTIVKSSNADPIYQTINYLKGLNRKLFNAKKTDIDCPYAILTDGIEWRLYRYESLNNDKQPSCLSLRLDQLDLSDDLAVRKAYRLIQLFFSEHATRRGGFLDTVFDENSKRALKIKDQLGKQVYEAVEYISNGIYIKISKRDQAKKKAVVGYYKKHFSGYEQGIDSWFKKVLYHESLVYLFRIIFGLYAEDRGLLEAVDISYGLKNGERNLLSDMKAKFGNKHGGDDWKDNADHVQFFDNEDRRLEAFYFAPINTKYNGGLFDPARHPLLADFDINDRYFLRAIDYLLRTTDPDTKGKLATISYAQLDVRHLGTIYENLLEFSLVDNAGSDADVLPLSVVNDKGERKSTGSYYTPDYIVEYIVQQTVGAKLDEKLANVENPTLQGRDTNTVDPKLKHGVFDDTAHDIYAYVRARCDALLSITVCDPAMGSGHFLIEVIQYIHSRIAEVIDHDELDDDIQSKLTHIYTPSLIASRCVYGVDINYLAVELAKVVMWIKTFDPEIPLQFLDANFKRGNSLIGTKIDDMFASDKMKSLALVGGNINVAYSKARDAIKLITKDIHTYVSDASDSSLTIAEQIKQTKLKDELYKYMSYRYFDTAHDLKTKLGDNLPYNRSGSQSDQYKARSKVITAHIQSQRQILQDTYGDLNPVPDWKALKKLYKVGLAAYNIRYMLTVPLAMEFLDDEVKNAVNLGYAKQVSSMLGKIEKEDGLLLDRIHLPSIYTPEGKNIQEAVDTIIQDINPFHWELEFPTVFAEGGFDCVVGNPPYVSAKNMAKEDRLWMKKNNSLLIEKRDLYVAFIELSFFLVKSYGRISLIIPDSIQTEKYGKKIRDYMANKIYLYQIDSFPNIRIFGNVGVYNVILNIMKKQPTTDDSVIKIKHKDLSGSMEKEIVTDISNYYSEVNSNNINLDDSDMLKLGAICFVSKGMVINADEKKYKGEFVKKDLLSNTRNAVHSKSMLQGEHVKKYTITGNVFLERNTDRVPKKISRPTFPELHQENKLVTNKIGKMQVSIDTSGYICEQTVRVLIKRDQITQVRNKSVSGSVSKYSKSTRSELENNSKGFEYKYILCLLNSALLGNLFYELRGQGSIDINPLILRELPIKKIPLEDQTPYITAADEMLRLHSEQHTLISSALRLISRRYEIEKLPKKLQKFRELQDFGMFMKELQKKNKALKLMGLADEQQLEEWYIGERKRILDYQSQIDELDSKIDDMVFDLYGLDEEERKVVLHS